MTPGYHLRYMPPGYHGRVRSLLYPPLRTVSTCSPDPPDPPMCQLDHQCVHDSVVISALLEGLLCSSRVLFLLLRNLTWRKKRRKRGQNPHIDQLILQQEFNSLRISECQDPLREAQKTLQDYTSLFNGRIGGKTLSCQSRLSAKSVKTVRFNHFCSFLKTVKTVFSALLPPGIKPCTSASRL